MHRRTQMSALVYTKYQKNVVSQHLYHYCVIFPEADGTLLALFALCCMSVCTFAPLFSLFLCHRMREREREGRLFPTIRSVCSPSSLLLLPLFAAAMLLHVAVIKLICHLNEHRLLGCPHHEDERALGVHFLVCKAHTVYKALNSEGGTVISVVAVSLFVFAVTIIICCPNCVLGKLNLRSNYQLSSDQL